MSDSIRIDSGKLSPTQSADAGQSDFALKSRDIIFSSSMRKSRSFLHLKTISLKEPAGKTATSYSAPSSPTLASSNSNASFKPFSLPESVTSSAAGWSMLASSPKEKPSESAAAGSSSKPSSSLFKGAESESKSQSPKATSSTSAAPVHRRDVMGYALLQNRDMKSAHRRGKVFLGTPSSASRPEAKRTESAPKGSISSMRSSSVSPKNAMRTSSPGSDSDSEGSESPSPSPTPASIELRMESPITVSASKGPAAPTSKSALSPMIAVEIAEQKSVHVRKKNYLLLPSGAFLMPVHRRAVKDDYALLSDSELDLVIRTHRRYRNRYLILPISAIRAHRRHEPISSDFDNSSLRNREREGSQDLSVEPELALLAASLPSPAPQSELMEDGSSPSPFRPNGFGVTPSPPSSEPNSQRASPVEESL